VSRLGFLRHPQTQLAARNGLGNVLAPKGDPVKAGVQFRLAAGIARDMGDRRSEGRVQGRLALSLVRAEARTEAEERLAAAEALLTSVDDPASLVELYCRWAEGALLGRDSVSATKLIERAERVAACMGSPRAGHLEAMLQRGRSLTAPPSLPFGDNDR